mgnify:CR=1 FL=1
MLENARYVYQFCSMKLKGCLLWSQSTSLDSGRAKHCNYGQWDLHQAYNLSQ